MTHETDAISLPPGLYLVATPIGNLKDITLRALETLKAVDVIYCEDTRQSGKLLSAYNIRTKTATYHDHSKDNVRQKIIEDIEGQNKAIALISDAGMPLISDPGFKLVQSLKARNIAVTSLPGANAPLTALQLSGLPSDQFVFLGFLPSKTTARKAELEIWRKTPATLVFYEGKQRIAKTLADIHDLYGNRVVCIARELTKKFEEVLTAPVGELLAALKNKPELKGEFVIMVAPYQPEHMSAAEIESKIRTMIESNMPMKQLAEILSTESGWQKKEVYNLALKLKNT